MKRLALAVSLMDLPVLSAHADDCMDKASSQAAMNECAQKAYQASDSGLNTLYRHIEQRLGGNAGAKQRLVAAQRSWVAFRDADCTFAASGGGSAAPMAYALCLDDLTKKRIGDFRSYLACGGQGDAACPVPAGK